VVLGKVARWCLAEMYIL